MATISSALSFISNALDANQAALSIVANNVANANTTGYSRQIASFQESAPVVIGGVTYGTGVTETGPTSVRDAVLEQRLAQQQLASASGSRLTVLNTVQALFAPASGSSASGEIGQISRISLAHSPLWKPVRRITPCVSRCFRPPARWPATSRTLLPVFPRSAQPWIRRFRAQQARSIP